MATHTHAHINAKHTHARTQAHTYECMHVCCSLSAYLPLAGENFLSEQNKATPILLGHGDADQVVS
eukprot:754980-Pelagomonas_calceolata.AAC.2